MEDEEVSEGKRECLRVSNRERVRVRKKMDDFSSSEPQSALLTIITKSFMVQCSFQ